MPASTQSKLQSGCLILFSLPFLAGGVFALVLAAQTALKPPFQWSGVLGEAAFGLTFTLAGTAVLLSQFKIKKQEAALALKRQHYPDSPWMWREDWSQGRVQSATRTSMLGMWAFALIWNLVSTPILIFVPRSGASFGAMAVAALFPAIGLILLIVAVRLTIRWEKFGKTWLDLATLPGVIGRELRGTIHVNFPDTPPEGVQLKLSCVNRVTTGSGKNRSTSEKILWREESRVSPGHIYGGPIGSSIPVAFNIPIDALDTSSENPNNAIVWCLQADAKMPGVDYLDNFEVPVFRTKDSPTESAEQASAAPFSFAVVELPREKPPDSGIVVRPAETGGTEYDFSAARNVGMAVTTTCFFVGWSGIVCFLFFVNAPIFFTIVFGLFDVLLLFSVASIWLGTSSVVIGNGEVRVHSGLLGIGPTRVTPFSEITGITMPIGMQSGSRAGTPFYDIRLKLNSGKEVVLARAIRNKLEAEWLIAKMRGEIGLSDYQK